MNREERRDHIVDCAKRLFVEKGFHHTTVSDVIEEARIARSTFYAHFTSKVDIFRILVDRYAVIMHQAILGINLSQARREAPLTVQIRDMTDRLVTAIEQNRDLTLLLITAPLGQDDDFDKSVLDLFTQVLNAIRIQLDDGIAGGTIRPLSPRIVSYVIMGSIKEILLQWLSYGEIEDLRAALDDIIAFILLGIATRDQSPSNSQSAKIG
ncbi:MAG: TetR/AcrR family transcriptional regulator [Spirochaetes bacterium]|nr:MAG: TetR/AcrR family transcriptional regulator [Spirochaetota bacterium]